MTAAQDNTEEKTITAIADLAVIELANDEEISEETLIERFPTSLSATVEGETEPLSLAVSKWNMVFSSTNNAFATDVQATFYYEPEFTIPQGYTNNATQPAQTVQVGEAISHAPMLASAGVTMGAFTVTGDTGSYSYGPHSLLPGINVLTITGSGALEISMPNHGDTTSTDTIVVQSSVTATFATDLTYNGLPQTQIVFSTVLGSIPLTKGTDYTTYATFVSADVRNSIAVSGTVNILNTNYSLADNRLPSGLTASITTAVTTALSSLTGVA